MFGGGGGRAVVLSISSLTFTSRFDLDLWVMCTKQRTTYWIFFVKYHIQRISIDFITFTVRIPGELFFSFLFAVFGWNFRGLLKSWGGETWTRFEMSPESWWSWSVREERRRTKWVSDQFSHFRESRRTDVSDAGQCCWLFSILFEAKIMVRYYFFRTLRDAQHKPIVLPPARSCTE